MIAGLNKRSVLALTFHDWSVDQFHAASWCLQTSSVGHSSGTPALRRPGEICGFERGAGLRHPLPRARMGLQAGDAGKKISAVQPPGFGSHVESVEIRSAVPRDVRIVLYPATVQMAVTVTAGDTLVDPHQTTMIARVGEDTIAHRLTPLPGRSMLDLVSTQPGWLLEANGILHPRGSEYQTQYLIDGLPLTDNRSPAFLPDLDADTVQALRVMTASYPAEYGRKLGGVVDVVTKSVGEDGIHGRASIHGGSDATIGESTTLGFRSGRYRIAAATEAGRTDRFLDPPVEANYTNEGRTTAVFGSLDVAASDRSRVGATVRRDGARFLVPNERVQQIAGQRQQRIRT